MAESPAEPVPTNPNKKTRCANTTRLSAQYSSLVRSEELGLTPTQQRVIQLYDFEDLGIREIARATNNEVPNSGAFKKLYLGARRIVDEAIRAQGASAATPALPPTISPSALTSSLTTATQQLASTHLTTTMSDAGKMTPDDSAADKALVPPPGYRLRNLDYIERIASRTTNPEHVRDVYRRQEAKKSPFISEEEIAATKRQHGTQARLEASIKADDDREVRKQQKNIDAHAEYDRQIEELEAARALNNRLRNKFREEQAERVQKREARRKAREEALAAHAQAEAEAATTTATSSVPEGSGEGPSGTAGHETG
ncbi:MAG: hypothetical protein M1838_000904 [Thelocarpon superellum]|nr:MAG: hypothetical protein M1838_000904 [Thelocarpon superellum]